MFSAADDHRATLLGFLIRDDDADDDVLVAMDPGLTVLYGLNGAGKSRSLEDIRRFWRGVASESLALIRVPEPVGDVDWNAETERGDWYPDWARRADVSFKFEDDILDAWLKGGLEADGITLPGIMQRPDRLQTLVDEWFKERLILVQAVGAEGEGRWVSAPAFMTGDGLPATNAEMELFEEVAQRNAWIEHGDEFYLTPFGTTADGRTICCASLLGTPVIDSSQWYFSAGRHDRLIELSTQLVDPGASVDERTRAHLLDNVQDLVIAHEGKVAPSRQLVEQVRELEKRANQEFAGVLQDAPVLRLHVNPLGLDRQVEWFVHADDRSSETTQEGISAAESTSVDAEERRRTLSGLSSAQRRWALWSIEMALHAVPAGSVAASRLILVDEPEAALHRSAEARMADYLSMLVGDGYTHVLAASHSPELLDLNAARVFEVGRRRGKRKVSPLTAVARENMQELGLMPSDLLRRQRGFILVEGQHDQLILQTLFGAELGKAGVEILALRGTRELSPARIAFLYSYTPGHVFIMLDNVVTGELTDAWEQVLHLQLSGQQAEAVAVLDRAECLRTDEGKTLREVLQAALRDGTAHRVTPHGLSRADIIEYLPVDALVPGGGTWAELRQKHQQARKADPNAAKDFKRWLALGLGADFGDAALVRAVGQLDQIPPDILRLYKVIEAHLGR